MCVADPYMAILASMYWPSPASAYRPLEAQARVLAQRGDLKLH
jgi:hypothetical protein